MFQVRPATAQDVPAIIDIAEQTWWPAYREILSYDQIRYMLNVLYAPSKLQSEIANGDQTYLVLEDDGIIRAFASFSQRNDDRLVAKVHKLYVLPVGQKQGYGRALIAEIEGRLRGKGIGIVELNVNRFNAARGFYERLGFRVVRQEDIPIGPYWMNDYVMRKEMEG